MELTPAIQAAADRSDPGTVVRLARRGLSMSQADLGRAIGYSQAAVSRLERGSAAGRDVRTLRLIASTLAIPGHLLGVADPTEEFRAPVNRRDFLRVGTAAAAVAPVAAAHAATIPTRVDQNHVGQIAQAIDDLRAVDQRTGGDRLQRLAVMQVTHAEALLGSSSYSEDVGRRLSSVLGEAAILAGWLSFDAGRVDTAADLYTQAIAAAGAADDELVAAHAYANMSMLAAGQSRPRLAIHYAQAGQRAAAKRGGPRLRSLLFTREAMGHAAMHDQPATREALARADRAFNSSHGQDRTWTGFVTDAELAGLTGGALRQAGDNRPGLGYLTEATRMQGRARNRASWVLHLAHGLIETSDPLQACAAATPNLPVIADLASTRIQMHARGLLTALRPYAAVPEVREFRERAFELGMTA